MKARRVKGLDPDGSLADNAERVVRTRVRELFSLAPAAMDPRQPEALHDLRIAAKRLRYVLEMTSPCFGAYAARAAKHARRLQDAIGEIHDCDVMAPLVLEHLARLREADSAAVRERAGEPAEIDMRAVDRAPNRTSYRPLELLLVQQQALREACFEDFRERWRELERSGFRKRLEQALSERPVVRAAAEPLRAVAEPSGEAEAEAAVA